MCKALNTEWQSQHLKVKLYKEVHAFNSYFTYLRRVVLVLRNGFTNVDFLSFGNHRSISAPLNEPSFPHPCIPPSSTSGPAHCCGKSLPSAPLQLVSPGTAKYSICYIQAKSIQSQGTTPCCPDREPFPAVLCRKQSTLPRVSGRASRKPGAGGVIYSLVSPKCQDAPRGRRQEYLEKGKKGF